MKRIIPALLMFIVLIMAAPGPVWAQLRLGFVDMSRVITQSERGKKSSAELKQFIESRQAAIQKREAELEKEKETLKQQQAAKLLNESALKEKEHDYTVKFREYQKLVADSNEEFAKLRQEFMNKMIAEIRVIVRKIGEKDGYSLILEVNNPFVLYHSKSGPNITDRIISEFNKSQKK